MEPADAVIARLDRIGELDRSGAAPGELLAELRGLLREAEAWSREQRDRAVGVGGAGGAGGVAEDAATRGGRESNEQTEEVVGRLREALARDIIER